MKKKRYEFRMSGKALSEIQEEKDLGFIISEDPRAEYTVPTAPKARRVLALVLWDATCKW